jgi:hypothetical protein
LKLKTGDIAVICDFCGNYYSIIQYKVQGFHWNNARATLHPFVAYSQNEMTEHISFVVISDCLKRNTVPAQLFQSTIYSFLSGTLKDLTKI